MNAVLVKRIYNAINEFPIFDPHTHLDHKNPTAKSLGDILSYHYYTELCNAADYEEGWWYQNISPDELVGRIAPKLPLIHNTVQFSWFLTICETFLGFEREELYDPDKLVGLHERSKKIMAQPGYPETVFEKSAVKRIFLTNAFNDPLKNLNTSIYRPCLRIDPFTYFMDRQVLSDMEVRTKTKIDNSAAFRNALETLFVFFKENNFAYPSVSAWPNTRIYQVDEVREDVIIEKISSGRALDDREHSDHVAFCFLEVTKLCQKHAVPFHLMIGVDKNVYAHGVEAGTDLVDSCNSLRGYDYLFNQFPHVRFPTSVLSDTQGLELTSSAWIRHNLYPSGHWWYLNNPTDIAREVSRRLEVVPFQKLIGYYSDAYFLEFILPKFRMYKFVLAQVLAEKIELSRIDPNMTVLSEEGALELAHAILWDNSQIIFNDRLQ